jgi:hypothetical protein
MPKTYLLILGAPRSGTTLLTAMIGCHTDVAMLNEELGDGIQSVLSKPIVGNKLCIPNQIELEARKPTWARLFGPSVHQRLYQTGFFRYQPESSLSIEDYTERYKPLKMIGILRDGNAVLSSIQRRGKQSLAVAAHRWRRAVEILHALNERPDCDLLLLTFEDLVTDPEGTMRRVAAHLGMSFQEQMLEGYAHTPIYSNRTIDSGRAMELSTEALDFNVASTFPETFETYQRLCAEGALKPA